MPHIIVKMYPGRTEDKKKRLAAAITKDVVEVLGCSEEVVSVAIGEVTQERWDEEVYRPDILGRREILYKEPGRPC
ncbi:MAG: tautomerase family protein [Candidatus Bipolaricaulis sp.]|nr:tautomerase family protein [Candidatus Bipolaricaulis sp.]